MKMVYKIAAMRFESGRLKFAARDVIGVLACRSADHHLTSIIIEMTMFRSELLWYMQGW